MSFFLPDWQRLDAIHSPTIAVVRPSDIIMSGLKCSVASCTYKTSDTISDDADISNKIKLLEIHTAAAHTAVAHQVTPAPTTVVTGADTIGAGQQTWVDQILQFQDYQGNAALTTTTTSAAINPPIVTVPVGSTPIFNVAIDQPHNDVESQIVVAETTPGSSGEQVFEESQNVDTLTPGGSKEPEFDKEEEQNPMSAKLELPAAYKKKVIKVNEEVLTYSGAKYLAKDEEKVKQKLTKYGVVILPDILTKEDCTRMNDGMWSTAEFLTKHLTTPVKRGEKESYRSIFELQPKAGGLFQSWGWGHAQYVWDIRSNPKVSTIFEKIFKTSDLLVSFDGVNCGLGSLLPDNIHHKGLYKGKKNLHCDQRFNVNKFQCIQSWVTANPTVAGDGTLRILEGSHALHEEFSKAFNLGDKKEDWHVLTEEQIQWYMDRGCKDRCIVCPAGAQVCWDSRLIHCGIPALKTSDLPPELATLPRNFRNVVYISMAPARLADKTNLKKRKSVFSKGGPKQLRMASHWPQHMTLFPKKPRYYGGKEPTVAELPIPNLNTRPRQLAGI